MYITDDSRMQGLTKYAKVLIIAAGIILGFVISRLFFVLPFTAQDNSMNPDIKKGDYVLILKIGSSKEGDIVLVKSKVEKGRVILKRLIAKGEKIVELKDKKIYINETEFIPKWKILSDDARIFPESFSNRDNLFPVKVNKGEVFVLGDNFDYSFDSRTFGAVDERLIIGRVIYKF
ncbi:MAG: signal peptidase I [Spirochaetota bacterium]